MKIKYPVYQPNLSGNEKKYVNDCLDSTWISSKGKYIELFEKQFADYLNIKYAVGVCNGTVALHLALVALGVGEGDEVIVPSFTYIASVNSITYTGAKPVFADCLKDTWQVDPKDIENKITDKTKAIMPVHIYGHTCDMEQIMTIAGKHDLLVVEDCAEAFGSKLKNNFAGSFGDISTFSFFGNKTITTGEGGMVVTNNQKLFEITQHYKGQGLAKSREYWHDVVGYNYRMTNICAAIGLAQLERADEIISKKRKLAEWYNRELCNLPLQLHSEAENVLHSYWMYNIMTENIEVRDELRQHLRNFGIDTRPSFFPAHAMPIYLKYSCNLPVTNDIAYRGINLPSYPDLTEDDIIYISNTIKGYFS